MEQSKKLFELLQSVSDVLFPAGLGEKKVEINSRGVDGDTPLHVIVNRNDIEGAKLLIDTGAEVNAVGDMGETPLHVAVSQENIDMIKLLLTTGAGENVKSEFGLSPRELAESKGDNFHELFM